MCAMRLLHSGYTDDGFATQAIYIDPTGSNMTIAFVDNFATVTVPIFCSGCARLCVSFHAHGRLAFDRAYA